MSNRNNKNNGKPFRKIAICLTTLAAFTMLTGCTPNPVDRAETLSSSLLDVYNQQTEVVDMKDFQLIGADVDKTSFSFDVNFNGIASFSDDSIGYTSLNYTVPSEYFLDLSKTSSHTDCFDVFDKIVAEIDPTSISVSPVSDIVAVNDAFIKNVPSPFEDYKVKRGLLYNLGEPTFNDEEKTVSFDVDSLLDLKKGDYRLGVGLGIGFNGRFGLGIGYQTIAKEGVFTIRDKYKISLDEKTYESMKNDPKLVFDYFVECINSNKSDGISAERQSITSVTYDNSELLDYFDIKSLNDELSK